MSLKALASKHKLPTLNDANNYQRWVDSLQDHAFALFKNTNLLAIGPHHTLDVSYFSEEFEEEYNNTLAELEAGGAPVATRTFNIFDPAHYEEENELFTLCLNHALATGEGFKPWVYTMFSDIKASLGPDMADKTAFVPHGDVAGLLRAVKLAINHHEIYDPDQLDTEYIKCTMEGQGQNEVARYVSALHVFIRRLEVAEYPPRDSKKQRVLLNGLDQEIFQTFISNAERQPYNSYESLVKDFVRYSQKEFMVKKLALLKPGMPHTMMTTKTVQAPAAPPQAEDRLVKIEQILATLTTAVANGGKRARVMQPCHAFQAGTCKHGEKCRFAHTPATNPTVFKCPHHRSNTHSAAECRALHPEQASINVTESKFGATHFVLMTKTAEPAKNRNFWIVDGAATCCATWDPSICFDVTPCHIKVEGSDKSSSFVCTSRGKCFVPVYCAKESAVKRITISDILISDNFPSHILSEIVLFAKGCTAAKSFNSWEFKKPDGSWLLDASQSVPGSTLYYVNTSAPDPTQLLTTTATPHQPPKVSTAKNLKMLVELHCANSHYNFEALATQHGLTMPVPKPDCWACMLAKPRHITHDAVSTRVATRAFEGLAVDWKGPYAVRTPEGFTGFFLIVDLYSSRCWAILASSSTDWLTFWPSFVAKTEAKLGKSQCISYIISDGAKIFSQQAITVFNDQKGIEPIATAPFSQWQNPAERVIQTVVRGAVADLIHGGGPDWAWGHAILHSADSYNRCLPTTPPLGHEGKSRLRICTPTITAEQEMRNHKPFGALCFKTIPKAYRLVDFNARAEAAVHLRYDSTKKAYAVLSIPGLKLSWSIELRFVCTSFPLRATSPMSQQLDALMQPTPDDLTYQNIHGPGNLLRRRGLVGAGDRTLIRENAALLAPTRRSERIAQINVTTTVLTSDQMEALTPFHTKQALTGPHREFWLPAILKDHQTLRDNKAFINVSTKPPPAGVKIINCEQRFKIKYKGPPASMHDLQVKDFKARTVAMGNLMQRGTHFDETAAPVACTPTTRMLVGSANARGQFLFSWDVEGAFYVKKIDKTGIIMRLPLGYNHEEATLRDIHLPRLYGEVASAIPGIPQGSLLFYLEIIPAWASVGFYPSASDPCLFVHESSFSATSIHVDDGVLAVSSMAEATALFTALAKTGYKFTWEPLTRALGIDYVVTRTPTVRSVFMHQRTYALTILQRAGMSNCGTAPTPAATGVIYTKLDCPSAPEERAKLDAAGETVELYHSLVQACNYLCVMSRFDLTYALGKLSKYVANPGAVHWTALKRLLRYIQGTLDFGIEFVWRHPDPTVLTLSAFCDSSYGDDSDTARSTYGYAFFFGDTPIMASSKLTTRVDSCVNHAEFRAFVSCTDDAPDGDYDGINHAFLKTARNTAWLRGTVAALQRTSLALMPPTPVRTDNSGVLSILATVTLPQANRHIWKTIAEARERVHLDRAVLPVKVDTLDNVADCLTKPATKSSKHMRALAHPRAGGTDPDTSA